MTAEILNHNIFNSNKMIVVPVKEGENIEKALKKFKRVPDLLRDWEKDWLHRE